MRQKKRKLGFIIIGFLLSAFCLWFILEKADFSKIYQSIIAVDVTILAIASLSIAAGIWLRSWRWRLLAGADETKQKDFLSANTYGLLTNLLLPGRLGDIVRIYAITKITNTRFSYAFSSAVIDRLLDLLVLAVLAASLFLLYPVKSEFIHALYLLVLVIVTAVAAIVFFVKNSAAIAALFKPVLAKLMLRWSERVHDQTADYGSAIEQSLRAVAAQCKSLKLLAAILAVAAIDYLALLLLLHAFAIDFSWLAPLFLWVFLTMASLVPSAPSYIGVYQVAAVYALAFFKVEPETSVALATILQVISLITVLALTGTSSARWIKEVLAR